MFDIYMDIMLAVIVTTVAIGLLEVLVLITLMIINN